MEQIRHIAIASDHPGRTAAFFRSAFGWLEITRYGLEGDPEVAPRPSGVLLTDGRLNVAILKFGEDQTGVGLDFHGIHHIGVLVDDFEASRRALAELGAPCIVDESRIPPNAHFEIKFLAPGDIVFDISPRPWPGTSREPSSG